MTTNSQKNVFAVIMAGGQGTRFWPVSRKHRPKQFLSISPSGESLLQATARRVENLVGKAKIWIVSNSQLLPLIKEHVPHAEVICEPSAKNTAACIGLAAVKAAIVDPEAVLVVLPADHAVKDEPALCATLAEAISLAAAEDYLVTIGVHPTHPHTGYGYIKRGKAISGQAYHVDRFFEKPNLERATRYVESPDFSWNSGMFVWKARVILEALSEFLPDMAKGLKSIEKLLIDAGGNIEQAGPKLAEIFNSFESISIDFGVLEHARNCAVIHSKPFGWNDVGSWDQWAEHFDKDSAGNLMHGEVILIDSENCVVHSHHKLTAVVGAKDMVIIDTNDALLVCPRDSVQEVRKVVDELRRKDRQDLI